MAESECVKVAVRCRPLNSKEIGLGSPKIVMINEKNKTVELKKPGTAQEDNRAFTYDFCYGTEST
jgi:kinesin family protein 3/17